MYVKIFHCPICRAQFMAHAFMITVTYRCLTCGREFSMPADAPVHFVDSAFRAKYPLFFDLVRR